MRIDDDLIAASCVCALASFVASVVQLLTTYVCWCRYRHTYT